MSNKAIQGQVGQFESVNKIIFKKEQVMKQENQGSKNGTKAPFWIKDPAVISFLTSMGNRSIKENFILAAKFVRNATRGEELFKAGRKRLFQMPYLDMPELHDAATEIHYHLAVCQMDGEGSVDLDMAEYAFAAAMDFSQQSEFLNNELTNDVAA